MLRKKLEAILFAVITCVIVITLKNNSLEIDKSENIKQTSSTPASGKVVILDAGHGGEDEGDYLLTIV